MNAKIYVMTTNDRLCNRKWAKTHLWNLSMVHHLHF